MKVIIEANYCPEADITYLMRYTYQDGQLVKMECIAFYCGEPNEDDTAFYTAHPSTVATYEHVFDDTI